MALVVPRALSAPDRQPHEESRLALGRERHVTPENADGAARACDRTSVEAKKAACPVATSTSRAAILSNVSQSTTNRAIAKTPLHGLTTNAAFGQASFANAGAGGDCFWGARLLPAWPEAGVPAFQPTG